jgi:hypothetical protein
MCKNCKSSELGVQRQSELEQAEAACKALNLNTGTAGFISRHAYRGSVPRSERGVLRFSQEEQQALDRYNAAQKAMRDLHNDYVWDLGRKHAQEMKEKGIKPIFIAHGDKR